MKIRFVSKKRADSLRRQFFRLQDRLALSASESRAIMTLVLFATGGMMLQQYRLGKLPPPMDPLTATLHATDSVAVKTSDGQMTGAAEQNSDMDAINSRVAVPDQLEAPQEVALVNDSAASTLASDSIHSVIDAAETKNAVAMGRKDGTGKPERRSIVPDGRSINVNTASHSDLQTLPGIGPAMARRIIDYRSQIGQFVSVDELMAVKGIGPKTLEKMRSRVTVAN